MSYKIIFIIILTGTLFFSCQKEDSSLIGKDILPQSDKFGTKYFEFSNINGKTVSGIKIKTQNRATALIGSINFNDEYGHTKADFLTQTRLEDFANDSTFTNNPIVDSVKLFLAYKTSTGTDLNYYGDTLTSLNFKVYEINNDIYYDSTYYSNFDISSLIDIASPICNQIVNPTPISSGIELLIDNSFGEKIINTDISNLSSNESFIEFIKGLYITTDSITSGGSILYLNLVSNSSYLSIFYHDDKDTTSFDLTINNQCAEISRFQNSGYNNISFNDSTTDLIYTQPLAGIRGQIDLSPVKIFADSENITINKAELVFNYYSQTNPEPARLFLQVADDKVDTITVPLDYSYGYYNGYFDSDNNTYSFVITQHVSDIISGVQDISKLYIYPSDFTTTANRATLINNFDNKNIKLKITYTKY